MEFSDKGNNVLPIFSLGSITLCVIVLQICNCMSLIEIQNKAIVLEK